MIHVIAIITSRTGKRAELLEAFNNIVPAVHAEKGCIEYKPVTDAQDAGSMQSVLGPDTYMVIEKWETMEDLHAHSKADHMVEFGALAKDLLDQRTIHVLS